MGKTHPPNKNFLTHFLAWEKKANLTWRPLGGTPPPDPPPNSDKRGLGTTPPPTSTTTCLYLTPRFPPTSNFRSSPHGEAPQLPRLTSGVTDVRFSRTQEGGPYVRLHTHMRRTI